MTDDRLIIHDDIMRIVTADWSSYEENSYECYSEDEYEYYSANELDNIVEPTYNDVSNLPDNVSKKPDVSNSPDNVTNNYLLSVTNGANE